ncbi:MAG TPA: helix-turn-helix transcriptional regulator [bacterium]|nr:helix-turn-helix transcriptional regulator [bacterium]
MGIKNVSVTAMKLGQDLISLGLKIQKKEIPLNYVVDKLDVAVIEEIQNSTEWEKDISPLDRMSALMEIQAISRSDLAKKLGVSRQFVSDVFNSKKNLTVTLMEKIATILGVKASTLMR